MSSSPESPAPASVAPKKSVLLLDDDRSYHDTVRALLGEGYEIRSAYSEEEFQDYLQLAIPDIFIVDWVLPPRANCGPNTEGIVRQVREEHAAQPVFVLTLGEDPYCILRCDALGARYIEKDWAKEGTNLRDLLEGQLRSEDVDRAQWQLAIHDREEARGRLDREGKRLQDFACINRAVVTEGTSLNSVCAILLRVMLQWFECSRGALVWLRSGEGVYSGQDSGRDGEVEGDMHCAIDVSELGRPASVVQAFEGVLRDYRVDGDAGTGFRLLNKEEFVRAGFYDICKADSFLLVSVEATHGDAEEAASGEPLAGLVFYLDSSARALLDDAAIRSVLEHLPLSSMLISARDMPFRNYSRRGAIKRLTQMLNFAGGVLRSSGFARKHQWFKHLLHWRDWALGDFLVRSWMEFLKVCIAITSVAIIALPVWEYLSSYESGVGVTEHLRARTVFVIEDIELAVMCLTILLVAVGVTVLFTPRYARGLPPWMERFTRVATLEKTVLTLVVIMLAISVLEIFVRSVEPAEEKPAWERQSEVSNGTGEVGWGAAPLGSASHGGGVNRSTNEAKIEGGTTCGEGALEKGESGIQGLALSLPTWGGCRPEGFWEPTERAFDGLRIAETEKSMDDRERESRRSFAVESNARFEGVTGGGDHTGRGESEAVSATGVLYYSTAGFIMIIALGAFIRLALHGEGGSGTAARRP